MPPNNFCSHGKQAALHAELFTGSRSLKQTAAVVAQHAAAEQGRCTTSSRGEGCTAAGAGEGLGAAGAGGLGLGLGLPAALVIAQLPLGSFPATSLLVPSQR